MLMGLENALQMAERTYGEIHKYKSAIVDDEKGYLIWDYIIWNEITFLNSKTGEITSFFESMSDDATESEYRRLVVDYGVKKKNNKLKKGDIIGISRGWYEHYGIYAGSSKVIHFTSSNSDISSENVIMKTSMDKFMKEQTTFFLIDEKKWKKQSELFVYDVKPYSRKETIARATSQIGSKGYSIWSNNCEHFAFWCKFGEKISLQSWLVDTKVYLNYPDDLSS